MTDKAPTLAKEPPTLRSIKDWPKWKNWVEQFARRNGIWEHVDPAALESDLARLKFPTQPWRMSHSRDGYLVNLNDEEVNEMMAKASAHGKEMFMWERKQDALRKLQYCINSSISAECYNELQEMGIEIVNWNWQQDTWQCLRALSQAYDRPTPEQLRELETEWLQIQALIDQPMLRYYLTRLDGMLKKCARFHLVKLDEDMSHDPILMKILKEGPGALRDQPWFTLRQSKDSVSKGRAVDLMSELGTVWGSKERPAWGSALGDAADSEDEDEDDEEQEEEEDDEETESEGIEEAESEEDGSLPAEEWEYCDSRPKLEWEHQ